MSEPSRAPTLSQHACGLCIGIFVHTPALVAIFVGYDNGLLLQLVYSVPVVIIGAVAVTARPVATHVSGPAGRYLVVVGLFVAWVSFSMLWSTSEYRFASDLKFLARMLAVVVSVFIAAKHIRADIVIRYLVAGSIVCSIHVLMSYVTIGFRTDVIAMREVAFREHYLLVTTAIGIGFVGSTSMSLFGRSKRRWIVVALGLASALLFSLGRGGLVSAVLIVTALPIWIHIATRIAARRTGGGTTAREWIRLVIVIAAVGGGFSAMLRTEWAGARFRRLFSGRELAEGGRGEIFNNTLEAIGDAPFFGYGLGTSGQLAAGVEGQYPHNLFLQVWAESGLVGLILLLTVVLMPMAVARGRRAITSMTRQRDVGGTVACLGVYFFLLAEYSKSYNAYQAASLLAIGAVLVTTLHSGYRSGSQAISGRSCPDIARS
jgi:O-antigen ligase